LYDDFLKTGGLPAVVLSLAADGDCLEILGQILADYERDFIRIFGEGDAPLVKGCLRNLPVYLAEQFHALVKGESSSVFAASK
jgi:hypothetical protein